MNLRRSLIKLAFNDAGLRPHLLPLLQKTAVGSYAFKPPKWMIAAVHNGELPTKVLLIWKYVVEKQGERFKFPAAIAYWRNKCKKEGIQLGKYEKGGGGKGALAKFPIKPGDSIEKWVQQKLASEGLIAEAGKTAAEMEMSISSVQRRIDECKQKIAKHQRGLARGSRVEQRKKWLAKAEQELTQLESELNRAERGIEQVTAAAQRHDTAVPSVAFEKEFQKLLKSAIKDMSQQDIMAKVLQTMAAFNAELAAAPAAPHAASVTAGVKDTVLDLLGKAWDKVKSLAKKVSGWISGLFKSAQSLNRLMDQAEAA